MHIKHCFTPWLSMKKKHLYIILSLLTTLSTLSIWWYSTQKITIKEASFAHLPGWKTTPVKQSLNAFRLSCKTFLKQDPEKWTGTDHIAIQIKDWQPACRAAMSNDLVSDSAIRAFFQTWFKPVAFHQGKPVHGLFTGYFMPLLKGSLNKTKDYTVPVYGVPSNLITAKLDQFNPEFKNKRIAGRLDGKRLVPFYTREEINKGALRNKAPILFWINSPMDRVFLEIEGSGVVDLVDGKRIYVGYASENGAPYTSIAAVMIKKGILTPNTASSENIKQYLVDHPKEIDHVLNQNKSFIFFSHLKSNAALGAQGVGLTPGYSLAIDPKWIPYGTPTWLSTSVPTKDNNGKIPFNRLMVAQDTGGAIRGTVRGDIFWGAGEEASYIANHMRDHGRYWLLLPRHIAAAVQG